MIIEDGKIYMVRGDDEVLDVTLTLDDGETPYEMQSGDVLTLTVRREPSQDSEVLMQIPGAPGSTRIPIRHEDTAQLEYGAYSADIQLYTADGLRKTVWPVLEASRQRLKAGNLKNFNIASEVTML